MESYSFTEARARLCELVRKVEAGTVIEITRHGEVVAHIIPCTDRSEPAGGSGIDLLSPNL